MEEDPLLPRSGRLTPPNVQPSERGHGGLVGMQQWPVSEMLHKTDFDHLYLLSPLVLPVILRITRPNPKSVRKGYQPRVAGTGGLECPTRSSMEPSFSSPSWLRFPKLEAAWWTAAVEVQAVFPTSVITAVLPDFCDRHLALLWCKWTWLG